MPNKMKVKDDVEMAKKNKDELAIPYGSLGAPTEFRPINWKKVFLTPKYIPWWILLVIITVITVLVTIYHDKVVDILRPFSEKVRDVPAGWLIPIVILIVISFPPLFGHEIIGLLCGVVYGLWIGFAIVAAGTFLGEVGTWFAFKKALRSKAEKLERTNLNYAALARVTRESGFWMVFIIRFSIVPSHFSTAVFSTCDVKFWHFCVATFLTLPKQIFIVYLGVLLVAQDENNKTQTIVLVITFLITCVMGVYIWFKMKQAKASLMREQAAREANHSMERLTQTGTASTSESMSKSAGGASESPSNEAAGMTWNTNSDAMQDRPLDYGYAVDTSRDVGKTMGDSVGSQPGVSRTDTTDSWPDFSRYNSTDPEAGTYQSTASMPAGPYYAMDQKPYYQKPSVQDTTPYPSTDQPQTNREWV